MPVAEEVAVPVLVMTMVPELTTVLDELPDTDTPVVLEVMEPLLVTVVGVVPVTVMAVLEPPATVPLLTTFVVGSGVVGLLMTTGPDVVPCGMV